MRKLVSNALTNQMAHFIFLVLKNLTLWSFMLSCYAYKL
jgi:hypothetical protein